MKTIFNDKLQEINKNFGVQCGSVDFANQKSFYLNISTWVSPESDDVSYRSFVKSVKSSVSNKIANLSFINEYMIDVDIRQSGFRFGKKSYLKVSLTLLTDGSLFDIGAVSVDISKNVIDSIVMMNKKQYSFSLRKK